MRARRALAAALAVVVGCAADVAQIDAPCPAGGGDPVACEAAGGEFGLAPHDECYCPTGHTLQRCVRAEDCVYGCVKPANGRACATATVGVCLDVRPETGCKCFLGRAGAPNYDGCAQ